MNHIDKNIYFHSIFFSNIKITKYFNYKLRFNSVCVCVCFFVFVLFLRSNLPRLKDGTYVINLNDKQTNEHFVFHYLLTEIQLCTLILLELNIFLKKN